MPPLNFSVDDVQPSKNVIDYSINSTVVTLASPTEQTGKLPADSSLAVPIWQSALEDAIDRSAVFRNPSLQSLSLDCKILKISVPFFGAAVSTDTEAEYQLINNFNGQVIYDKRVDALGVVPFSYNFVAVIRARESINVSAQNNISAFLQDLEASPLAVPR